MPLADLNLPITPGRIPSDVRAFLREAERRIRRFGDRRLIPAFVPSDFERTYEVLQALAADPLQPGNLFCEWGSGFGVVACLAALLDFDACGIEIEEELVDAAQQLADDFDLAIEFIHGSFIPPGSDACFVARNGTGEEFAWLSMEESRLEDEMGLGPADFNVIFAYPWPDEEGAIESLFERHAEVGAVLVTYHGGEQLRLRRKTRDRKKKGRRDAFGMR